MGAVKSTYWDELMARSDNCEDMEFAALQAQEKDPAFAAFQLRQAIDLARRRLCRSDIEEIIQEELSHGKN